MRRRWLATAAFAKAIDKDGAEALRSYLTAEAQEAKALYAAGKTPGFAPF